MSLRIGIVGLPNVGKSTLFNSLIRSKSANAENYPFCTIDPNVGVVEVPDSRLNKLTDLVKPEKTIPTTVEFVDIAGLVAGASKGEGLGNQFLSHIREVDAICEVVRVFADGDVVHVAGSVDAKRDIGVIETELILADLQTIEKRSAKYANAARTGNKEGKEQMEVIGPIKEALENGKRASSVEVPDDRISALKELQLLTSKPMLYVFNTSEDQLGSQVQSDVPGIQVCAKVEEDLMDLSPDESKDYLNELGIKSSGLDQLIRSAYELLGLITFFTAGPKECRAWTIEKGDTAPDAAGTIHTDFKKGFIRAETIAYKDYIECDGEIGAKDNGKMRSEGKDYVVQDGDVMLFRFNV
jgi:ribosome-binding ATPase